MWNTSTSRATVALAALTVTAACGGDQRSVGVTGPAADHTPTGRAPVVYEQIEFLGNPLVSEVTIAKANHEAYNKTQPYNTATFLPQSAAFITSFGRPLSLAQTLGGVLYPDILIVDTSKDPATAGWLSWALAGGWGGRKLADDVVDVGLSAIFSSLLTPEGAKCAPFQLPLCTDNIAANDRAFSATFPYLAAPNTALPARPDPDGPGNAAPVVEGLRPDPASGPYPVTAKSCGGRFTVCVRFQVTDADGSSDTPAKVVVDWGDGTSWAPNSVPMATPLLAPHDYTTPGTYTVRVTATDRRGAAATPVTLTLQVTGAAPDPRRASLIHDRIDDFLPSFTGVKMGELDVRTAEASFDGSTFVFTHNVAVTIEIADDPNFIYVWGVDRGRGTARFPDIAPGVRFDAVVVGRIGPNRQLTAQVTDLTSGPTPVTTDLPAGSMTIGSNQVITIRVPANLLPMQGLAPAAYTVNLWPRSGVGGGNGQIADFAPDNRNAPVRVIR